MLGGVKLLATPVLLVRAHLIVGLAGELIERFIITWFIMGEGPANKHTNTNTLGMIMLTAKGITVAV